MSEATTISAILKSTEHGPAWHGPSVLEVLDGVSAEQALKHPLEECHSIWEIVLHLSAWHEFVLDILRGEIGSLEVGNDWPATPTEPDAETWETAKRHFEGQGQEIRELIMHLDEDRMHETVPGKDFSMKVMLHGLAEHTTYHTGQIALLKKLV
jgi:uncharacterized damage-inducible protein DinB